LTLQNIHVEGVSTKRDFNHLFIQYHTAI